MYIRWLVTRDEGAASVCRGPRCCHAESPQSNQVNPGFIGRDAGLLLAHAFSSRGELSPASSVLQQNGSDGTRWTDETGPWRFGGVSGSCDWLHCMFGAMSRRLTGMSKWKAGPLTPLPGGGIAFPPPLPAVAMAVTESRSTPTIDCREKDGGDALLALGPSKFSSRSRCQMGAFDAPALTKTG
jgi:hypothetical protein